MSRQLITTEALLAEALGGGTAFPGFQVSEMHLRAAGAARPLTDRYWLRDRHAALRSGRWAPVAGLLGANR